MWVPAGQCVSPIQTSPLMTKTTCGLKCPWRRTIIPGSYLRVQREVLRVGGEGEPLLPDARLRAVGVALAFDLLPAHLRVVERCGRSAPCPGSAGFRSGAVMRAPTGSSLARIAMSRVALHKAIRADTRSGSASAERCRLDDRTSRASRPRRRPAADHLRRRPRDGAARPVAARASARACATAARARSARAGAPGVQRRPLRLRARRARRRLVRRLALRRHGGAHRAAARSGRLSRASEVKQHRGHVRGLPARHLPADRAPRRHGHQPRRGGAELPQHLPAVRRAGLRRARGQGARPAAACRSTTTG